MVCAVPFWALSIAALQAVADIEADKKGPFMRYAIRELGLGGILDQSVQLTKNHFGVLLAVTAILLIPYNLISGFVTLAVTPELPPNPTPEQILAATAQSMRFLIPQVLIGAYIVIPLTNAALVYCIANLYLGQSASVAGSFQRAFRRILGLIGTWFLLGLAIMGGMLLCIVPGILAAFWFSLATQVVVIEGISGFPALKRSRDLMKGNIATLFAMSLVLGIICGTIGAGAGYIPQPHVRIVVSSLIQSAATILWSAAAVVFYFSCRCKLEQFDLALLAQSVGVEASADTIQHELGP